MYIYRITNTMTGFYYVGQTNYLDKRIHSHKKRTFAQDIKQYGEECLSIEILKQINDKIADTEECKITILEYVKNQYILNKAFGHFFKSTVDKALKNFESVNKNNIDNFYEFLYHFNDRPNVLNGINKNQQFVVFRIRELNSNNVYIGKYARSIKNSQKVFDHVFDKYKINRNSLIEKIDITDYENAFKLCMKLSVKAFINGDNVLNKMFEKMILNDIIYEIVNIKKTF